MAISFVANTAVVTGSNPTVAIPAGYTGGDLLVIVTDSSATPSTPTGWTQAAAQGAGQFITVFYKIASNTESSVALTVTGTSTKATMLCYRGTAGIYDVVSSFNTGTSTSPVTLSQTTRFANDFVLSIYGVANSGTIAFSGTPGSTNTRVISNASSTVRGLLIVDEVKTLAGSTATRTATLGTSATWATVSLSIREPLNLYWTGTGNWSSTTLWKIGSTGGSASGVAPAGGDNIFFDSSSGSGTCTINATALAGNITIGSLCTTTLAGSSALTIYGNVDDSAGFGYFTYTYTGAITFSGGSASLNASYIGNNNNVTFNATGSNFTLLNNFGGGGTSRALTLTGGNLILNGYTCSFGTFNASGTTSRGIDSSVTGSLITVTATTGTVVTLTTVTNLTFTGRLSISSFPAATQAATRTFTMGTGTTESNAPSLFVLNSGGTVSITGNVYDLTFENYYWTNTGTITNNAITIYGDFFINDSLGNQVWTWVSGTNAWTFASTSGVEKFASFGVIGTTINTKPQFPLIFNGVGGKWSLGEFGTSTASNSHSLTLTNGYLTIGADVYFGVFSSSNSNTRSLDALGNIFLTGNNTTVWNTATATNLTLVNSIMRPNVILTYAGGTGTRTISAGSITGTLSPSFSLDSGGTATDTLSFTGNIYSLDLYTGGLGNASGTFSNSAGLTIHGDLTANPQMTYTSGSNPILMSGSGTKYITSNLVPFNNPFTFDDTSGIWVLVDAFTLSSNRTLTLTSGTIDLNENSITCGLFLGTATTSKTLAFGNNGILTLNGTGTVLNIDGTYFTCSGSRTVYISNNSATATTLTLNTGFDESNALDIYVNMGTFTLTETSVTPTYRTFDLSGFSGTLPNIIRRVYGGFGVGATTSLTAGANITYFNANTSNYFITNGKTLDFPLTFNGSGTWQLQDALTVATSRAVILGAGTLDLNNNNITCGTFNSNNSNTRSISFGTGQFYLTGGGSGTTAIWRTDSASGLTITGSTPGVNQYPTINATYSGNVGTRQIVNTNANSHPSQAVNMNITAGSDIFGTGGTPLFKNVDYTGFSGNSTFYGIISGNLTFSNTMTTGHATGQITFFSGNNETQYIKTNGCIDDQGLYFGQRTTVTGASGDGTTATLTFGSTTNYYYPTGSTIEVSGMTPTGYNGTYTVTDATLTSVSYLNPTTAAMTVAGQVAVTAQTYKLLDDLTISNTKSLTLSAGTLDFNGKNVSCGSFNSAFPCTRSILFGDNKISITGSNSSILTLSTVGNFSYTGNSRIEATYSGSVGTRSFTGATTGTGVTEDKAMNLYITGGTDRLTVGGSTQRFKKLDFTGFSGTLNNTIRDLYGDLIISPTMTCQTGANTTYFVTGGTQTITTNGNPTLGFPVTIQATGTVILNDDLNLTASNTTAYAVSLTSGTLDFNDKTITSGTFNTNNTNIRTMAFRNFGSLVLVALNTTVLNAATYTNLTVTGNSRIDLNYPGSIGTRIIDTGYTGNLNQGNTLNIYVTAGTDTVTFADSRYANNVNFTGFSGTLSSASGLRFYGDLTFSPTMTITANNTGYIAYGDTRTQTITMNGRTLPVPITFSGSNTEYIFADAFNQTAGKTFNFNATANSTLTFASGLTHTVGSFSVSGTSIKYLKSTTPGSQATISQASGTVTATYLNIRDSNATGGATWDATAATNVNAGNNTGWTFGSLALSTGNFLLMFI